MWVLIAVDDFESHGDGVGANHAVALDLRGAAGADVFDVGGRGEAQAGGVETGTGADGAFEEWRLVTRGFDFAGCADFARFENDRPSGNGGEELFGERNHAGD